MTKTMVILKEAPFFFAAFAALQYHHTLPSSCSRILATLPLAVEFDSNLTLPVQIPHPTWAKAAFPTPLGSNDGQMPGICLGREMLNFPTGAVTSLSRKTAPAPLD